MSFGEDRNTDRLNTDWVFDRGTGPSRGIKGNYVITVGTFQNLYRCVKFRCVISDTLSINLLSLFEYFKCVSFSDGISFSLTVFGLIEANSMSVSLSVFTSSSGVGHVY